MNLKSAITLLLLLTVCAAADARQRDVGTWVSLQLAPNLIHELTNHPRFKGESIRLVVFNDDRPAAMSNELELSLRDRLAAAVLDVPGIRLAAQQDPAASIDCTRDDADYYIGMQLTRLDDDKARISLRTLDMADFSWVTGLDLTWQGELTRRQVHSLATPEADGFFRGQRSAPFEETQADVMAARLARDLGCQSMRQMHGEYMVFVDDNGDLTGLVASNLSRYRSLQFTTNKEQANAMLSGQSHAIDSGLQQYWVTISPLDPDVALPSLSASAYVETAPPAPEPFNVERPAASVLTSAQLVTTGNRVAMQIRTQDDAVVFFLNHQKNHGLVRLSAAECRTRTLARVARANQPLNQDLPLTSVLPDAASPAATWSPQPEGDAFVAIAVANSEAAHVLSQHLQKLPQRCTAAARFGLEGEELEDWMREFAAKADAWAPFVDWQAIQVRNVY